MIATKYFSLIGSQNVVANQRAGILWLSCRYIMRVLILKLSKSFYYESDLHFHVHKSWLSTSYYWICAFPLIRLLSNTKLHSAAFKRSNSNIIILSTSFRTQNFRFGMLPIRQPSGGHFLGNRLKCPQTFFYYQS